MSAKDALSFPENKMFKEDKHTNDAEREKMLPSGIKNSLRS